MILLGMDVGGTKCASVLAQTHEGGVTFLKRTEIATQGSWHDVLNALTENARRDMEVCGVPSSAVQAVGISCGGPLDAKRGLILSPPNLPAWDRVPVQEYFENAFGAPARLMNDADACAVAEWTYGAGKGLSDVIFLTFGTGMGAGLILNGKLYEGANSNAGEIGHVRLSDYGPAGYGKRGSFEGFCSGAGIARAARTYAEEKWQCGQELSFWKDKSQNVTAKDVALAAAAGDEDALVIYRETGRHLGRGLSILIDVLNPQMIILGGVYMRSHKLLEETMLETLERECLPRALAAVSVVPSQLGEQIGDYGAVVAGLFADQ